MIQFDKFWPVGVVVLMDTSAIAVAPAAGVGAGGVLMLYFLTGAALCLLLGKRMNWFKYLIMHTIAFALVVLILVKM